MKKRNYIGEISDIFQIPPSTLRYWDKESLIRFSRNEENNYRFPSFQTVLDMWDIMFYRNLSIPLKKIKLIPKMNIDELNSTLIENKKKLIDELHNIKKTIKEIESREKTIEIIKYLNSNTCCIEKRIFPPIKLFNSLKYYTSKEMTQLFLANPYECLLVTDSERSFIDFGTFASNADDNIFREKDDYEKPYFRALLKVETGNIHNSNCNELILNAEKLGYKTGLIISQYLISACEDKRYDYYEAWIELL